MTVHPMRPPKKAKPAKTPAIQIDRTDGLTITFEVTPAEVKPFPKK